MNSKLTGEGVDDVPKKPLSFSPSPRETVPESLGTVHAEQLLFSCLCSKVTVYSRKLQCFFRTSSTPSPVSLEFIELVPKNVHFRNIIGV